MPSPVKRAGGRPWRRSALLVLSVAGFAVAALVGVALAKSMTLAVGKNVKVVDAQNGSNKKESIVTNSKGVAVYVLTPETTHHLLCTSKQCLNFWPPVKVASAKSKLSASGIKGKLGTVRRKGYRQLTLAGHPLYTFLEDKGKKGVANGDKIANFGGVWHVITVKKQHTTNAPAPPSTTPPAMPYGY